MSVSRLRLSVAVFERLHAVDELLEAHVAVATEHLDAAVRQELGEPEVRTVVLVGAGRQGVARHIDVGVEGPHRSGHAARGDAPLPLDGQQQRIMTADAVEHLIERERFGPIVDRQVAGQPGLGRWLEHGRARSRRRDLGRHREFRQSIRRRGVLRLRQRFDGPCRSRKRGGEDDRDCGTEAEHQQSERCHHPTLILGGFG